MDTSSRVDPCRYRRRSQKQANRDKTRAEAWRSASNQQSETAVVIPSPDVGEESLVASPVVISPRQTRSMTKHQQDDDVENPRKSSCVNVVDMNLSTTPTPLDPDAKSYTPQSDYMLPMDDNSSSDSGPPSPVVTDTKHSPMEDVDCYEEKTEQVVCSESSAVDSSTPERAPRATSVQYSDEALVAAMTKLFKFDDIPP